MTKGRAGPPIRTRYNSDSIDNNNYNNNNNNYYYYYYNYNNSSSISTEAHTSRPMDTASPDLGELVLGFQPEPERRCAAGSLSYRQGEPDEKRGRGVVSRGASERTQQTPTSLHPASTRAHLQGEPRISRDPLTHMHTNTHIQPPVTHLLPPPPTPGRPQSSLLGW
jgi:hypothetical protein